MSGSHNCIPDMCQRKPTSFPISLHSRVDEVELVRMPLYHHSEIAPRGGLLDPTGDLDGLAPATGGPPAAISAAAAVGVALVRSGGALIGFRIRICTRWIWTGRQ